MYKHLLAIGALAGFALAAASGSAQAATLVANYNFNNSLSSSVGGAPDLVATDPLGLSGFTTATVNGHSRTVYSVQGQNFPVTDQAGLTFDNSGGLLASNNYSVNMVFSLADRVGGWRRLVDVQNRQSDNGFYVDPENTIDVYPVTGSPGIFSANTFTDVALTVAADGTVQGYLNGTREFTTTTAVMNIDNPDNVMNFFLDNVVAGGQGEWSSGQVANIALYNGVLSDSEVARISAVPLPGALPMFAAAIAGIAGVATRRRRVV